MLAFLLIFLPLLICFLLKVIFIQVDSVQKKNCAIKHYKKDEYNLSRSLPVTLVKVIKNTCCWVSAARTLETTVPSGNETKKTN